MIYVFILSLLMLSAIDWHYGVLPNAITLNLLVAGLLINFQTAQFVPFSDALLGAILAYVFLELIYWTYRGLAHREGLGRGDLKLFAAIGAWLGWRALPWILLIASLSGLCVGLFGIARQKKKWRNTQPFGPHLTLGAYFVLCFFM